MQALLFGLDPSSTARFYKSFYRFELRACELLLALQFNLFANNFRSSFCLIQRAYRWAAVAVVIICILGLVIFRPQLTDLNLPENVDPNVMLYLVITVFAVPAFRFQGNEY